MQNIVVVAAHPDDELIGIGGTLYKHAQQGDNVNILILGDGKSSRKANYSSLDPKIKKLSDNETLHALRILGISKFTKKYLPDNRFDGMDLLDITKIVFSHIKIASPEIVYTHHLGDQNIDHRLTAEAVVTACRPIENNCVMEIRMFETLSSTEMAGYEVKSIFQPNLFIDIKDELSKKLEALSFYKSELHEFPHPRSIKAIEYNAYVWGAKNNLYAAEAFHVFKSIKKNA